MKKFNVGVQMYSLRESLSKDFEGTLRKVKEIGYDFVEFAGNYGGFNDGKELKKLLDDIGLKSVSVHQSIHIFIQNGKTEFQFFKDYGIKYVVIPYYSPASLPGSGNWEETLKVFKSVAEMAREYGINILYHNHEHELEKLGDEVIYDIMFRDLEGYVDPEPDTCWLNYGGVNPAEYIRKYGDRINIVHLKDFVCTKLPEGPVYEIVAKHGDSIKGKTREDNGFVLLPLGRGCNNFSEILSASEEIDADYVIVEQDFFTDIEPIDAMLESRNYLRENFGI